MQEPDASVFRSCAKKFGIRFVRQHSRRARNAHCAAGTAPDMPGIGTAHNRYVQTPALADGLTIAKSARRCRNAPTGFLYPLTGSVAALSEALRKKQKLFYFGIAFLKSVW